MDYEQLRLSNQVWFPIYAASRLITREYQPLLEKMGLTYPQYLVMMILWETDGIAVNKIAEKLILNTNTVTPLLKRMDADGLITRSRSGSDERKVIVKLTPKGKKMKEKAAEIPQKLMAGLNTDKVRLEEIIDLRDKLNILIESMLSR